MQEGKQLGKMDYMECEFLAFDTETTGVNVNKDRIVSASLVRHMFNTDVFDAKNYLINPGVHIPFFATSIHKITNEMVQKAGTEPKETLDCIADEIASAQNVGIPLVVFNAGFDIPLLESELQRYSLPSLKSRISADSINVLDPMILDIVMNPYRKGRRNLETLITVYGVELSGSLHSAEVDSVHTLKVLDCILNENPLLIKKTNSEINSLQRRGYENWAKGLNEYRVRIGKVPSMSTKWF